MSGRGIWSFNGAVWSVVNSTLFRENEVKQVLLSSTGICGAVSFVNEQDFGKQGLFLADGTDAWIIDSTDTVTQVDKRYLQWSTLTDYQVGDRRIPILSAMYPYSTYWYVCIVGGLGGTTEPAWPTAAIGDTVTDGAVTWRLEGLYGINRPIRYGPTSWTLGQETIPTVENGYWYEVIVAGSSSTEPALWPLIIGDTVVTGDVTFECKGQYGGFPSPHIPTPAYMDGYIFLPEPESVDIWNSDVTAPSSWGALNFMGAESYSDPVVALARQNNFIVALGTISTEFLYNYAKANELTDFDTPLDRYESLVINAGVLTKDCIMQTEKILIFIGTSATGGKSIWRLDGGNAKEISTEYVEKFIDLESPTSGVTGFCLRIAGHILYIVNLPTADRTFVYDLEEGMWCEWQHRGGMLPFMAFCDHNGDRLVQHTFSGNIYKFDPLVYKDDTFDMTCLITLSKQDLDSDKYKFFHKTVLIGDTPIDSDIVRWSDDDYVTWSNDHTLQPQARPYIMRTGKARRRAWELEYTHDSPRRLESLEILYSIAEH